MACVWEEPAGPARPAEREVRIDPESAGLLLRYMQARNRWLELQICGASASAVQAAESDMRAAELAVTGRPPSSPP